MHATRPGPPMTSLMGGHGWRRLRVSTASVEQMSRHPPDKDRYSMNIRPGRGFVAGLDVKSPKPTAIRKSTHAGANIATRTIASAIVNGRGEVVAILRTSSERGVRLGLRPESTLQ